jgi:hypothetical protein
MPTDYAALAPDALLEALSNAGREPDPALIAACLPHREALTPTLLDWLGTYDAIDFDEYPDDDPRWYRPVHAGKLLAAWREPRALPFFERIFSDEDDFDMGEWFCDIVGPAYGMEALPMAEALVERGSDNWFASSFGLGVIDGIGRLTTTPPEERERLAERLTRFLPPLLPDGSLDLPASPEKLSKNWIPLWTNVISRLIDLRSHAGEATVRVLFAADLYDPMYFGDEPAYDAALKEPLVPLEPYDVVGHYDGSWRDSGGWPPALVPNWDDDPTADVEALLRDMGGNPEKLKSFTFLMDLFDAAGFDAQTSADKLGGLDGSEKAQFALLDEVAAIIGHEKVIEIGARHGLAGGIDLRQPSYPTQRVSGTGLPYRGEGKKPGRNDPCPCGSGKKYKRCCGRKR